MRAPLGVGLRMNWLFVVKKRRAAGSRPMIVVPWSANTKLAPNRLGRDHIGSCALIDIFWHHLLEQDFLGVWHTLLRNGRFTSKWWCQCGCRMFLGSNLPHAGFLANLRLADNSPAE